MKGAKVLVLISLATVVAIGAAIIRGQGWSRGVLASHCLKTPTVGDQFVYSLVAESTIDTSLAAFLGRGHQVAQNSKSDRVFDQHYEVKIAGELEVTIVKVADNKIESLYRLLSPEVRFLQGQAEDSARNHDLSESLSKPFVISKDPTGVVQTVSGDPTLSSLERKLLIWLASQSQFIVPKDAHEDWTTSEQDANGHFEAVYHAVENFTEKTIHLNKRKIKYTDTSGTSKKRRRYQALHSDLHIEPNLSASIELSCADGGVPRTLLLSDNEMTSIDQAVVAQATDAIELRLKNKSRLSPEDLIRLFAAGGAAPLSEIPYLSEVSEDEARHLIQSKELGTLTIKDLHRLLKKAKNSSNSHDEINRLYLKFKALAYLHPEECAHIAQIMLQEASKSPVLSMLATALSSAGTPAAQAALVDVIEGRAQDVVSTRALIATLGMTDQPTQATEDAVRTLISTSTEEELIRSAGLALGSIAGHLADTAPDRQKVIVKGVLNDYNRAETDPQKKFLLGVLGNTGSEDALQVLDSAVQSTNPKLQAEAAMALRFIPGTDVDKTLLDLLQDNSKTSSEDVKKAAAVSLGYRELSGDTLERLKSNFENQPYPLVRVEIVRDLTHADQTDPKLRSWLSHVKDTDPSKEVKRAATNALSFLGS